MSLFRRSTPTPDPEPKPRKYRDIFLYRNEDNDGFVIPLDAGPLIVSDEDIRYIGALLRSTDLSWYGPMEDMPKEATLDKQVKAEDSQARSLRVLRSRLKEN